MEKNIEIVKRVYADAIVIENGGFFYVKKNPNTYLDVNNVAGYGKTEAGAWASAARKLK